jgi:NAD(P)-dependent dehydrogenase (short-subunit alcohol dehydrogenase family)
MTKTLAGKIALVTGASRGIGRAIAERLAKDGATVAVHYGRSKAAADDTVAAIKAAGGDAFLVGAELTEKGAVGKLFAELDAELKRRTGDTKFDILVNNAGIAPMVGFAESTEAHLDEIYTVNVKAPYLISQEAVKRLKDEGRIINLSSVVVRVPAGMVFPYSVLKGPIDVFTRALAVELGPRNITVNAIAPGVIDTDMTAFMQDAEVAENVKSKQALKRIGAADDIAGVAAFLAADSSRWVTGQVIEVSGGTVLTF